MYSKNSNDNSKNSNQSEAVVNDGNFANFWQILYVYSRPTLYRISRRDHFLSVLAKYRHKKTLMKAMQAFRSGKLSDIPIMDLLRFISDDKGMIFSSYIVTIRNILELPDDNYNDMKVIENSKSGAPDVNGIILY
jgi:hypothetical protein